MLKISIASDHHGIILKQKIVEFLLKFNYKVTDLGPNKMGSYDYPDYAHKVVESLIEEESEFGILICKTGIGMSMAANRHSEIRAALCQSSDHAEYAREHNNANILCLGGFEADEKKILDIVDKFLTSNFKGGRHIERLAKIS